MKNYLKFGAIAVAVAIVFLVCILGFFHGKNLNEKPTSSDISSSSSNDMFQSKREKTIKLLGDSITSGMGGSNFAKDGDVIVSTSWATWNVNTKGYCWANLLKEQMELKYSCTVKNWGTDGVDSDFILDQINQGKLVEKSDDMVILMIGTNDRLNYSKNGSKEKLYENISNIVDKVQSMNKEIILMSSIPASKSNEESTKEPKIFHMSDVDQVIQNVARDKGMEYISLYKGMIDYCSAKNIPVDDLLRDGVHPNDEGYLVMYDLIRNALGC